MKCQPTSASTIARTRPGKGKDAGVQPGPFACIASQWLSNSKARPKEDMVIGSTRLLSLSHEAIWLAPSEIPRLAEAFGRPSAAACPFAGDTREGRAE